MNKKILSVALAAAMLCSAQTAALAAGAAEVPESSGVMESIEASGVVTSGDYTYDVVDNGAKIRSYLGKDKKVTIPATIDGIPVTGIGDDAFAETSIEEVVVPKTITDVDPFAFEMCFYLKKATINKAVINHDLSCVFGKCSDLETIVIQDDVTDIPENAFKYIHIKSVTIPSSVTTIRAGAFESTDITSIDLSKGVRDIGDSAFRSCRNLTNVKLSNSLNRIGERAFENTGFANITLPQSLMSIGEGAFVNSKLKRIDIPARTLDVGFSICHGCEQLEQVTLNNGILEQWDFNGMFYGCNSLKTVSFGNDVSEIPEKYFRDNSTLEKVILSPRITTIGETSFDDCPNVTFYCYRNSPAEEYANSHKIPTVIIDNDIVNTSTINKTAVIKGSAVKITGSATGGSQVYDYRFSYKRTGTSSYTVRSDYGKATSLSLTPAYVDTYTVKVDARDTQGNVSTKELTFESLAALNNNSTVSTDTIPKGCTITIKGAASGGKGPYKYKYSYKRSNAASYTVKSDYSSSASVTLTPSYVDLYNIKVDVKDSVGNVKSKTIDLKVTAGLENKSSLSHTVVEKGSDVKMYGAAQGGKGSYKYKYSYKKSSDSTYTVVSDYTASNSAGFVPSAVGTYNVKVDVKDETGKVVSKVMNLTSAAALENKSSLSHTVVDKGDFIKIYGAAQGGQGSYQYRYSYKKKSASAYTVLTDYTGDNSTGFTPTDVDTYNIKVDVKDASGKAVSKVLTLTSTAVFENKSSVSDTTIQKGTTIKIYGRAAGGTGSYQFKFSYKRGSSSNYTVKSDFGKSTAISLTPQYADTYSIKVEAKDTGSGKIISKVITVKSNEVLKNKTSISTSYDDNDNTVVTINANAAGGTGGYKYAFYYKKTTDSTWTTKGTEFGTAKSAVLSSGEGVSYNIKIVVKDSAGHTAEKQITLIMN